MSAVSLTLQPVYLSGEGSPIRKTLPETLGNLAKRVGAIALQILLLPVRLLMSLFKGCGGSITEDSPPPTPPAPSIPESTPSQPKNPSPRAVQPPESSPSTPTVSFASPSRCGPGPADPHGRGSSPSAAALAAAKGPARRSSSPALTKEPAQKNATLDKFLNRTASNIEGLMLFRGIESPNTETLRDVNPRNIKTLDHLILYATGEMESKKIDLSHEKAQEVVCATLRAIPNMKCEEMIRWMATKKQRNNPDHCLKNFPERFPSSLLIKCLETLNEKYETQSTNLKSSFQLLLEQNQNKREDRRVKVNHPAVVEALSLLLRDHRSEDDRTDSIVQRVVDCPEFDKKTYLKFMEACDSKEYDAVNGAKDCLIEAGKSRNWQERSTAGLSSFSA